VITGVSNLQYGAGAILAIVLLAIVFGYLIPRWTVNQLMKAKNDEIKAKDRQLEQKDREISLLREVAENYRAANLEIARSSDRILTVNEVTTKALHALTSSAHQGEPDEAAHLQASSQG
jgi:uncharacterized membrane-anchored protein YhcB (DUF1043 family)